MRKMLLASAALLGMALAVPAIAPAPARAQDNTALPAAPPAAQAPAGGETTGQTPSAMNKPGQMPRAHHQHMGASNIVPSDTHSTLAHALPSSGLGPNASAVDYLRAAQEDLRHHRGGAAQEAMERAETRLLDRSVPQGQGNVPDTAPAIQEIHSARDALGHQDWRMAQQHLDMAVQHAQMAMSGSGAPMPRTPAAMPPGQASTTSPMTGTGAAVGAQGAPPTTGDPSMPYHNVLPPNGGVEAPNGDTMSPNQQ